MNSTARERVTIGGWGTEDEMCLSFLSYYPKSAMARCQTFITLEVAQTVVPFPDLIEDL
jgi:hypothetical protein